MEIGIYTFAETPFDPRVSQTAEAAGRRLRATLDLLSGGRAEIVAGRGSFSGSFPLFGYDLEDYDELFADKLGLLLELRDRLRLTWSGEHRAPLKDLPTSHP